MSYIGAVRGRDRVVGLIDPKLASLTRVHGTPTVSGTYSSYIQGNLIDTNDATGWVSSQVMNGSPKPWCLLDLGTPRPIAKVRVMQSTGVDYATQFQVDCSDDNSTWVTVHTTAAGLGTGEYLWYPPMLTYQFWKLLCINGGPYGWNISSYELFGPSL